MARKRATHKELRVFIPAALKAQLQVMCEAEGVTQAEMIAELKTILFHSLNHIKRQ
ncbi:copB [Escherichia coli]|nr:RepB family protein [Escherichia coli]OKT11110.1 copB [Escherichia coli]